MIKSRGPCLAMSPALWCHFSIRSQLQIDLVFPGLQVNSKWCYVDIGVHPWKGFTSRIILATWPDADLVITRLKSFRYQRNMKSSGYGPGQTIAPTNHPKTCVLCCQEEKWQKEIPGTAGILPAPGFAGFSPARGRQDACGPKVPPFPLFPLKITIRISGST